ncbi:LOW QUALITY PROTEIN: LIM domain only protein 7-like [Lampris incognitus]|uniref:LOW QUALITY PROTEIN: LIM domain only protein 7-like n=1 Tax=Lampris incognitus TaxID=2546036 RepID=UPI0024B4B8B7|nr:LOW QUALITY PROTEIN: LIM domain only protein 7-like [Lampris incognitus]
MEWREQTSVSCEDAFREARRWMEEVTGKPFGSRHFRAALENGVLLCDLINQLKPGLIKRVNRLSTPIAGLDNVSVFLKACGKLGLHEAQLFHPGDLQDLSTRVTLRREESNRRLKNVLITIYWLGRKAQLDPFYSGPQLNLKALEGLLGLALSRALEEGGSVSLKGSGHGESWYLPREDQLRVRPGYGREYSVDCVDSPTLHSGCGSDTEADQVFQMETTQPTSPGDRGSVPPSRLGRTSARQENGTGYPSPLTSSNAGASIFPRPQLALIPTDELLLRDLCEEDSEDDDKEADPVLDDLYARRVRQTLRQTSSNLHYDHFLPQYWTPEEEIRVRRIYLGSQRRPWYRKLQRLRSKSLSDIPMVSPARISDGKARDGSVARESKREPLVRSSTRFKDSEAKWQDDLTKWKNRRRSTTSDLRRKLQEREHVINQMISGAMASPRKTAGGPLKRMGALIGAMPASNPTFLGEDIHLATLASDGGEVTTPSLDCPLSSQAQVEARGNLGPLETTFVLSQPATVDQIAYPDMLHNKPVTSTTNGSRADVTDTLISAVSSGSSRQAFSSSIESTPQPSPVSHVTVDSVTDLSYQNKDSPTEAQTRSSQQPAGLYRQVASSQIRIEQQARVKQEREKESGKQKAKGEGGGQVEDGATSFSRTSRQTSGFHHQPYANKHFLHSKSLSLGGQDKMAEVYRSDLRVSLSLKPNSRPDFGFQTHWDSTGVRVKSVQVGGPAELCQLRVGDEIVAVNGLAVTYMSYDQWNSTMASALHTGGLTMELRRYGNKDWSSNDGGHASLPSQSKKALNLTAAAPMLIGHPEPHANSTAGTKTMDAESAQLSGTGGTGVNGESGNNPSTTSSKGIDTNGAKYEHIVVTNRERRADFFKEKVCSRPDRTDPVSTQGLLLGLMKLLEFWCESGLITEGGSESAISDLQVPSLSQSSSSWSWDHEEERRRQERSNVSETKSGLRQSGGEHSTMQQERWTEKQRSNYCKYLQQSSYKVTGGIRNTTSNPPPANRLMSQNGHTKWSANGEEESKLQRDEQGAQNEKSDKVAEQYWARGSSGFAQLSPADRSKSRSTPALSGLHKHTTGDRSTKTGPSVSKAEQERQQILEEMKKRTQLLKDNSWIRQRSTSVYKEPIYMGVPMRRYESLDNLYTSWRQSPVSATSSSMASYYRPHSAAAGYSGPGRSISPRYSVGGAGLSQKPASWSMDSSSTFPGYFAPGDKLPGQSLPGPQQSGRLVSGRRTCCVCEHVLGRGAAMVIEALGLNFHLACFQCVACCQHLGGRGAGVQVRIRNGRPYCESCYFRLKCEYGVRMME